MKQKISLFTKPHSSVNYKMYLEIVINFFKRELKTRYNGSVLGPIWIITYPIIIAFLSSGIFSNVFNQNQENNSFFLYILMGSIIWVNFFYSTTNTTRSLRKNREIVANINFNWSTIIISEILVKLLDFIISLFVFFIFFIILKQTLNIYILLIPFLIIIQTLFLIGIGLTTATLFVYFKDIQTTVEILLQLTYLTTPIIYPISIVPEKFRWLITLNPIATQIDLYRQSILSKQLNINNLIICFIECLVVFIIGLLIFKKHKDKFPELI